MKKVSSGETVHFLVIIFSQKHIYSDPIGPMALVATSRDKASEKKP